MTYEIAIEKFHENYAELEPIYRRHYGEMQARLAADGFTVSAFKPRLPEYFEASKGGWLLNYVVRSNGQAVGYANIYLTSDMHNGDFIATEDAIYVLPEHRNGIGVKLAKFALADVQSRGVRRVSIEPVTDLRVAKIWQRLGFRQVAVRMVYEFDERAEHVLA